MSDRRPLRETMLPVAGCPLVIALLSDLHDAPIGEIAASLSRRKPDVICVTGDYINAKRRLETDVVANCAHVLPFFRLCASAAPTFVSLGNHEWMLTDDDIACIEATGAVVLRDRFVRHRNVCFGGLTSSIFTHYRREVVDAGLGAQFPYPAAAGITTRRTPELDWLEAFASAPGYHILLCHHPEYFPLYLRDRNIELTLSGHAHGGQIRLFGHGLYAPGQGLFPKLTGGVYEGRLAVSRGLANTSLVPRLFNPPEMVYITPAAPSYP